MILMSGSVTPVESNNFDLSSQEFHDALAIRYCKPLLNLPPKSDSCGATSSLDYFLICRKGGLVVQHHNEIRDAIGDLAVLAWGQLRCETVVVKAEDQHGDVEFGCHRLRHYNFDIRVIDTDAQS